MFFLYCFIVFCVLNVYFFSSKDLSTSSMCVLQLQVLYSSFLLSPLTFIYHLWTFSNHCYLQFTPIIPPSLHFFATTIIKSSNPNNFVSMKVKPNGLSIGVKCLKWCNSNNIVSILNQDVSSKVLFNVGTNELIVQEILLKNLK